MNIILSAFACEPGRGSEQEVGWKWAIEMAAKDEIKKVLVLTQSRNQASIEKYLSRPEYVDVISKIEFYYIQFPDCIYRLKSRFDFLTLPYYALWQILATSKVRRLLKAGECYDLVHHVTFATFRVPVWMRYTGLPFVVGPIGGAEKASWSLLKYRSSFGSWLREAFRNLTTNVSVGLLAIFPMLKKGEGICLAATPRMDEILRAKNIPCELYPTIGTDLVDRDGIQRSTYAEKCGCRFLYVGRLHLLKGVQFILPAFTALENTDASLTIVGSGPERDRLHQQAKDLGLSDKLKWVEAIPREELKDVYLDHDVIVAPSMYESGGLVVLEGMEYYLPSIVLDVGGHAVTVDDSCGTKISIEEGVEGVIRDLTKAMDRYATDPDLRCRHGQAGRNKAAEIYHWPRKTEKMLGVYRQVTSLQKDNT